MNRYQKKSEDTLKNFSDAFIDVLNNENEIEEVEKIELLHEELNEAELNYELDESQSLYTEILEVEDKTVKEEIIEEETMHSTQFDDIKVKIKRGLCQRI